MMNMPRVTFDDRETNRTYSKPDDGSRRI